jgi:hypothetical protein
MAMQFHARNRTKSNLENKVGTKLESLANFAREFIGESGGYRAQEFAESIRIDEPATGFPSLARATQPTRFGNCTIKPADCRKIR